MVDTYPFETIPRFASGVCIDSATTEPSSPGALNGPLNVDIQVSVSSNSNIVNQKQYHDQHTIPILINNYYAGDTITITVDYSWNNGVAVADIPKDYSISVYAKQRLTLKNSAGVAN